MIMYKEVHFTRFLFFKTVIFFQAVMDIKDEVNWMLKDEIAFALSKSSSLSKQTMEFICRHVQTSSRIKPGSRMDTIDLEFVFGSEKSFQKFKEHFGKINLQGIFMKKEDDFYYLGNTFYVLIDFISWYRYD